MKSNQTHRGGSQKLKCCAQMLKARAAAISRMFIAGLGPSTMWHIPLHYVITDVKCDSFHFGSLRCRLSLIGVVFWLCVFTWFDGRFYGFSGAFGDPHWLYCLPLGPPWPSALPYAQAEATPAAPAPKAAAPVPEAKAKADPKPAAAKVCASDHHCSLCEK